MSETGPTVAQAVLPPDKSASLPESQPGSLEDLRRNLGRELKSARWDVVRDQVLHKLAEALDDPLIDHFAGAWRKLDEIRQYADRGQYPPGVTSVVPLYDHDFEYTQQPQVQVLIGGRVLGSLKFDVTLSLVLKSVELEIKDGKITRVLAGSWQGVGSLGLEGREIYEKKLSEVPIDGAIALGAGIDIAGDRDAVPAAPVPAVTASTPA
jgi:hypothetical protein